MNKTNTSKTPLITAGNTQHCQAWRSRIYARHKSLRLEAAYKQKMKGKNPDYVKANHWLDDIERSLKVASSGLYADCDDQQIRDYAEAKSKIIEKQLVELKNVMGHLKATQVIEFLEESCTKAGVELPYKNKPEQLDEEKLVSIKAAIRRVCEPAWWRKQLRKISARQFEQIARSTGQVSRSRQIYCSDFTLRRRTEQKQRNRLLLESLEAENSAGQTFTLAELADLSVSNPVNRRNELMTRISGFEGYAKNRDNNTPTYKGLFLTLTAPSKYHAQITRKGKGRTYAIPNPKYNGSTPKEANDQLCKIWSEIRADWQRRDINPYGFRMVEPHHDGTPHWHLILFLPETQVKQASTAFKHHALKEDGAEAGALKNRVKIIEIDPTKGSAAGYCAKYVAKNIDGFGIDSDLYGRDAVISAMRIEAWASTWGIRQFQQIGGPSVTVWREARRVKEELVSVFLEPRIWGIIDAADAGNWELYTELMGGAACPRKDRPLRPMMIEKPETNQFGETVEYLFGILGLGMGIPTRAEVWTIRPVSKNGLNQAAPAAANAPPKVAA